jgi:glycosyltransferase involved in cell wall biosynthesis
MQLPKVSILIPTYNQTKFLARAIESALVQDYPNIEVIVSDDASTENVGDVVASFLKNPNFSFYRHTKNIGRVANYRYLALTLARGDWAVNLDGDDFYTDNSFVSNAINRIYSKKDIVFYQAGQINNHLDGALIKIPPVKDELVVLNGKVYFENFSDNYYFSHLSTIYNLDLIKKLNFTMYEEDIISSDVSCFLKLALHGNVMLSKDIIGEWTGHEDNCTKVSTIRARIKNNRQLIDSSYAYALKINSFDRKSISAWRKKMKTSLYLSHLLPYMCSRKFSIVFSISAEALSLPFSLIFSFRFIKLYFGHIFRCVRLKLKGK